MVSMHRLMRFLGLVSTSFVTTSMELLKTLAPLTVLLCCRPSNSEMDPEVVAATHAKPRTNFSVPALCEHGRRRLPTLLVALVRRPARLPSRLGLDWGWDVGMFLLVRRGFGVLPVPPCDLPASLYGNGLYPA